MLRVVQKAEEMSVNSRSIYVMCALFSPPTVFLNHCNIIGFVRFFKALYPLDPCCRSQWECVSIIASNDRWLKPKSLHK